MRQQPNAAQAASGRQNAVALALWVAASLAAGAIGSFATASALDDWYAGIEKPSWTPPGWLFGPVWTTLYVLMGVAAWRVWRHQGLRLAGWPQAMFLIQLILNAAWSLIFFGARMPGLAFAEILVLMGCIVACIAGFWRVDRTAALLLVPYVAWVSFATALNFAIWRLNAAT